MCEHEKSDVTLYNAQDTHHSKARCSEFESKGTNHTLIGIPPLGPCEQTCYRCIDSMCSVYRHLGCAWSDLV